MQKEKIQEAIGKLTEALKLLKEAGFNTMSLEYRSIEEGTVILEASLENELY